MELEIAMFMVASYLRFRAEVHAKFSSSIVHTHVK